MDLTRGRSPDLGLHSDEFDLSGVFKTEFVIHRVSQFLFAAKVAFGGLNRRVSKQKLDLLQLSAGQMTETGTSTATISHAA
jgi:hypothetical protein